MSKSFVGGAVLVSFLAGLLVGIGAGGSGEPPPQVRPKRTEGEPAPSPDPRQTSPEIEEVGRLRERIRQLEEDLAVPPPVDDPDRRAGEIHRSLSHPKAQEDTKAYLRLLGQLADLRPSMTPAFVRLYREARPRVDAFALELAIASGGPEAVALLKEIFGNPSIPKAERIVAGMSLTGQGLLAQTTASVPPDPELMDLATRTLAFSDPVERQGGAGLLGLQGTDASRATLQALVSGDRDEPVRFAAVRALARIGDRSSLEFLQSYAKNAFPGIEQETDDEKLPPFARAILESIKKIGERFPED